MLFRSFFPLIPGGLAVFLGLTAVARIRKEGAKGSNLAVAGIVCAFIAMAPTALLVPALLGWGGKAIEHVQKEIQKPQPLVDAAAGAKSPAGERATLRIERTAGSYSVVQSASAPGASQTSTSSISNGRSEVAFSLDASTFKYKGKLTESSRGKASLEIELENRAPFRLTIDGLENATTKEDGRAVSLAEPLPPGKHRLSIVGSTK